MRNHDSPLRRARKALGLTVHAVAEKSGLDASSVSRIERGEQVPPAATAKRLAAAVGLSAMEILFPNDPAEKLTRRPNQRKAA